jgi:hypothetical protein
VFDTNCTGPLRLRFDVASTRNGGPNMPMPLIPDVAVFDRKLATFRSQPTSPARPCSARAAWRECPLVRERIVTADGRVIYRTHRSCD